MTAPQSLSDIEERLELLRTTLGLFAPEEPGPIADELVQMAGDTLRHRLAARGLTPVTDGTDGAALLKLARQAGEAEAGEELIRRHGQVAAEPEGEETVQNLQAMVETLAVVVSRVADNRRGGAGTLAVVAALLIGLLGPAQLTAEEVSTRHRGLTLLGNLELAEGRGIEDGVALVVHGTLAHSGMEIIAELQKNLKMRGVSTLAITLSLGQDRRTGFFDCGKLHTHRPLDALDEIDAWIGWLKNNGATDIALIGHSQGGSQVAAYAAERNDPSVSALALLAPLVFNFPRLAEAYQARYQAELSALLAKAQTLVQSGNTVEHLSPVGFLSCADATVTAGSFVAWYAPSPLRNTPDQLPRIRTRTLVLVAGNDELIPDLGPAVEKSVRAAAPGRGEIKVRTVEGADHFFRDIFIEDAADFIAEWLKG